MVVFWAIQSEAAQNKQGTSRAELFLTSQWQMGLRHSCSCRSHSHFWFATTTVLDIQILAIGHSGNLVTRRQAQGGTVIQLLLALVVVCSEYAFVGELRAVTAV